MKYRSEENVADILTRWIDIATERGMVTKVLQFWLLRDYVEGTFSDAFFERHVEEARKALAGIDTSKVEGKRVVEEVRVIVEGWG